MKKTMLKTLIATALCVSFNSFASAQLFGGADAKDERNTNRQQKHYSTTQPVPFIDYSTERARIIETYRLRSSDAATHAVWRSEYGMIEGDCSSLGYSIPYGASITSPNKNVGANGAVIAQAEPLGPFPPETTKGTWVFCVGNGGLLEPILTESNVSTFPYPVSVDYETNRVKKAGKATVTIKAK